MLVSALRFLRMWKLQRVVVAIIALVFPQESKVQQVLEVADVWLNQRALSHVTEDRWFVYC